MQNKDAPNRVCAFCRVTIPAQAKFCYRCGKDVRSERTPVAENAEKNRKMPIYSTAKTILLGALLAIFLGGVCIGASTWFSQMRHVSSASPVTENVAESATTRDALSQPTVQPAYAPVLTEEPLNNSPTGSSEQKYAKSDLAPEPMCNRLKDARSLRERPQTSVDSTAIGQQSGRVTVICLDPGHPSEVGRGTTGKRITEIQAVWRVALKLRLLLQQQGIKVVMTKQGEAQFVRNEERAKIANQAHAALMVRLHCDSDAGSGVATYAPTRQGRNNGKIGPELSVIADSQRMAQLFHPAMMQSLHGSLPDRGLKSDTATQVGGKQGALTGSIYSQVPVLLVEMCVLTNPRDEAFIDNEQGQQRMAQAVADGVTAALQARKNERNGKVFKHGPAKP